MDSVSLRLGLGFGFLVFSLWVFQATAFAKSQTQKQFPYKLDLYFSRVDGLREGNDVRILGIKKGFISRIEAVEASKIPNKNLLDPQFTKILRVEVSLQEPVSLWDNYNVEFQTKTLFSGRVINIHPGSFRGERTYPKSLDETEDKVMFPTVKYFDDFFKEASGVLKENREDLRNITRDLARISDKLNGQKGTIPKLINSQEMYESVFETVNDAQYLGIDGRRYVESSRKLESLFPIPFLISSSFIGGTTLSGRPIGTSLQGNR